MNKALYIFIFIAIGYGTLNLVAYKIDSKKAHNIKEAYFSSLIGDAAFKHRLLQRLKHECNDTNLLLVVRDNLLTTLWEASLISTNDLIVTKTTINTDWGLLHNNIKQESVDLIGGTAARNVYSLLDSLSSARQDAMDEDESLSPIDTLEKNENE